MQRHQTASAFARAQMISLRRHPALSNTCNRRRRLSVSADSLASTQQYAAAGAALVITSLYPLAVARGRVFLGLQPSTEINRIASEATRLAEIVALLPFFNWAAWLFFLRGPQERRFGVYAVFYCAPYLGRLLAGDCADVAIAVSVLLGALHMQAEKNVQLQLTPESSVGSPVRAESDGDVYTRGVDFDSSSKIAPSELQQTSSRLRALPSGVGTSMPNQDMISELAFEERQLAEEQGLQQEWDRRFALRRMTLQQLKLLAKQHGVPGRSKMKKGALLQELEARGAQNSILSIHDP